MGIGTCIIAKPWSRVTINNGDIKLQKKNVSITQNGNVEILPDSGYDGLSSINISSVVPTFVKTNSFDILPTDNVLNGTIGLIQEEENVFEPFTPGIETNALLFDTSFNLLNVIQAIATGKFIFVSNSGKESEIFKNNALYLPSNSISFIIAGASIYVIVNKSDNYYLLSNDSSIPSDEIFLKEGVIKIFKTDGLNFSWITNYVEFSSVILDTFYIFNFDDGSLTSESVDNYLQLNKWMKCSTNNVENKVSQVYEYNDSWENISKDIILQEKTEFANSLTPSTIEITPDEGADALSKVTIDLSPLELQTKTVNITQNGQTTITPDEGKIGLDEVVVNTAVLNGGENLLSYNNLHDYSDNSSFWSGPYDEVITISNGIIRAESSKTSIWSCVQNKSVSDSNNFNFDTTKKYTISFRIKSNDGLIRQVGIRDPGNDDDVVMDWVEVNTFPFSFINKTITFTPLKSSCRNGLVFITRNPTGEINDDWIEIRDVKIEEGPIATPFSKSINDQISLVDSKSEDHLTSITQNGLVNINLDFFTWIDDPLQYDGIKNAEINISVPTNYEKASLAELNALTNVPNNSIGLITNAGSVAEVYKYSNSSWNKIPLSSDSGSANQLDSNDDKQTEESSENNLNNDNYIDDFRITVSTPGYKKE
jgi:hypothetical protein